MRSRASIGCDRGAKRAKRKRLDSMSQGAFGVLGLEAYLTRPGQPRSHSVAQAAAVVKPAARPRAAAGEQRASGREARLAARRASRAAPRPRRSGWRTPRPLSPQRGERAGREWGEARQRPERPQPTTNPRSRQPKPPRPGAGDSRGARKRAPQAPGRRLTAADKRAGGTGATARGSPRRTRGARGKPGASSPRELAAPGRTEHRPAAPEPSERATGDEPRAGGPQAAKSPGGRPAAAGSARLRRGKRARRGARSRVCIKAAGSAARRGAEACSYHAAQRGHERPGGQPRRYLRSLRSRQAARVGRGESAAASKLPPRFTELRAPGRCYAGLRRCVASGPPSVERTRPEGRRAGRKIGAAARRRVSESRRAGHQVGAAAATRQWGRQ